jgi:hypothetical protein
VANSKITDLPASTGVTGDELIEIVNNPAGSPVSQKATVDQLANQLLNIRDFKHAGATLDRYYAAAHYVGSLSGIAVAANNLFAMPFVTNRSITIDRIGIVVTVAAAGNVRLGIYNSVSQTDLTPNSLILDSGLVDVSVAQLNTATINQTLSPNVLYWFCCAFGVGITVRALAQANAIPILGYSAGNAFAGTAAGSAWTNAFAFAALPATFPSPAIYAGAAAFPLVFYRASA